MRLYEIVAHERNAPRMSKWVGSQAELARAKRELLEAYPVKVGLRSLQVHTHDVPVRKDQLVDWLTKYANLCGMTVADEQAA